MLIRFLVLLLAISSSAFASNGSIAVETVTTAAGEELGTEIGRAEMVCVNMDQTNPVYWGYSSAVTSSTGFPIAAGGVYEWNAPVGGQPIAGNEIYARATGGTVEVRCDQVFR